MKNDQPRVFNDKPSPLYLKAKAALKEALDAGESIDDIFGEIASVQREQRFNRSAQMHQRRDGHVCFDRLARRPCRCDTVLREPPAGSDHLSEWVKNKRTAVIASQPYTLGSDQVAEMLSFAKREGLDFTVGARQSWHYPGSTLLVTWTRRTDKAEVDTET